MNPDKLKIFQTEFDKSKKDGLSEQEKNKLEELFRQVPKDKQEEFLAKKDNLSEPLKSFVEGLKQKLNNLRNDIDKVKLKGGFEELKENFKDSEIAKEFFDLIDSYIDLKLDKNFSKKQKNQIKLALLGEIESGFNLNTIGEGLLNKVLKPLKQKIENLKGGDFEDTANTDDIPGMSEISNSMDEMFNDFGLELKVKELDKKIEDINAEKDSGEISDLKSVLTIINPDNAENINFETIKTKTEKIVGVLNSGKDLTNKIQKGLEKLPFGLGDVVSNWIRDTIKEGGILGIILGFFFGKEFMDESGNNMKKSLKNLEKFSENDKFPLSDNIEKEDIEKLEPKKLEKFHKFVNSKKDVESSSETFWQELLTGKTNNTEIKKLHDLFKNEDGKILSKDESLEDLVAKLNNLEVLESEKNRERLQAQSQQLHTEIQTTQGELIKIEEDKTQAEQNKQEAEKKIKKAKEKIKKAKESNDKKAEAEAEDARKKAEAEAEDARKKAEKLAKEEQAKKEALLKKQAEAKEKQQENEFNNSVMNITELPAEIIYKGKKFKVYVEGNILNIGNKKFNIQIARLGEEENLFDSFVFRNGNLYLKNKGVDAIFFTIGDGETYINKGQLKTVFKTLLENKDFTLKIPDDSDKNKTKAILKIRKA